jgi:NAD(P)-dependent dehydrogenase (short-subunit alcohol dehydrogenase family)
MQGSLTFHRVRRRWGKLNSIICRVKKKYNGLNIYCNSKLMNVLFTYELAKRLEGTGITVNSLHPGLVATNFGKGTTDGFIGFMVKYLRFMMISPEKGAETAVFLASSPEVETVTGKYFVKKKPAGTTKQSYDSGVSKKLFELSEEMVKRYSTAN